MTPRKARGVMPACLAAHPGTSSGGALPPSGFAARRIFDQGTVPRSMNFACTVWAVTPRRPFLRRGSESACSPSDSVQCKTRGSATRPGAANSN